MAEKLDEARRVKLLEDLPNFLTLDRVVNGVGPDPIVWRRPGFAEPRGARDILVMSGDLVEMMIADVARNLDGEFLWSNLPGILRPPEISASGKMSDVRLEERDRRLRGMISGLEHRSGEVNRCWVIFQLRDIMGLKPDEKV